MDLGEAGIGEEGALLIGAVSGGHIAAARIGRKIKNISITARSQNDRVPCVSLDFSRSETAGDDSLGLTIDEHDVEHFRLWKHLHSAGGHLAAKRLITTEQKLLTGLPTRVKRSRNLRAAE